MVMIASHTVKIIVTIALLFATATAQDDDCTEPKEILILSNEQFPDRNFRRGGDGTGDYCVYLGGDANLFVRKYNAESDKCNGERIWKSHCRCNRDGAVDYWMRFQNDGNLLVRNDNIRGPYIWKSETNLPECNNNSSNNRKLTDCPSKFAFVVTCNEGVAIWSLDNSNNPAVKLWERDNEQHGGGRCKRSNCP